MAAYIALLRGINVVGANILPMKELVAILESLGVESPRTYIASGNAVFRASAAEAGKLPGKLKAAIRRRFRFAPEVFVLGAADLKKAIAANPYPEADRDPRALHLVFYDTPPKAPDFASLEKVKKSCERYALKGKVLYFYSPEGVGKSKLFAKIDKAIGVGTARNWNTVRKLAEMAS